MDNTLKKVLIIGEIDNSKPLLDYYADRDDILFYICDIFEKNGDMRDYNTFSMHDINEIQYDCIIITTRIDSETVKKILVNEYNVDGSAIIEFWKMYNAYIPLMVCDRVMLNPKCEKYDGIICGLSHTEVGILTEKIGGDNYTFCNLSVSSQDMYFQYKTLKYCLDKYPHKLADLKYAIIETHDYNYFNFDTTMGRASYQYLCWGGYNMDPHNFNNNPRYDFTFEQALQSVINNKYGFITEKQIDLWEKYCNDVFAYNDFNGFGSSIDVNTRTAIVTDDQINNYFYSRAVITKIFPDTIKENIDMFQKLLELLKSINPDIKIYSLIVPRYRETQDKDRKEMKKHIEYFNNAIDMLQKEYGFEHLDYSDNEIANHRNYYYDAVHLNLFGADVFTNMLNNRIFGI